MGRCWPRVLTIEISWTGRCGYSHKSALDNCRGTCVKLVSLETRVFKVPWVVANQLTPAVVVDTNCYTPGCKKYCQIVKPPSLQERPMKTLTSPSCFLILICNDCTEPTLVLESRSLRSSSRYCSSAWFDCRWQYRSSERFTKILTTLSWSPSRTDAYLDAVRICSGIHDMRVSKTWGIILKG